MSFGLPASNDKWYDVSQAERAVIAAAQAWRIGSSSPHPSDRALVACVDELDRAVEAAKAFDASKRSS